MSVGCCENERVTESPSAAAQHLLHAVDAVLETVGSANDAELVALLTTCAAVVRRLDRVTVDAVAALDRRGVFAEKGYTSPAAALSDLLGFERTAVDPAARGWRQDKWSP